MTPDVLLDCQTNSTVKFCGVQTGASRKKIRIARSENRDVILFSLTDWTARTLFCGWGAELQRRRRCLDDFVDAWHGQGSSCYLGQLGHFLPGGELSFSGGGGALTILLMRGMVRDLRFFL